LTDIRGNVIAGVANDPAVEKPIALRRYDEYGNPASSTATFGWLGAKRRRQLTPRGITQMGVRVYVPEMGRFTSADPVEGGSANDYEYGAADPVNSVDLDGRALAYPTPTSEEAFCRRPWNIARCVRARSLAKRASAAELRLYGARANAVKDGPSDAYRHCYWNGLMAFHLGQSFAEEIGNRNATKRGLLIFRGK